MNLNRPDGQLCDKIFWKFHWKSFLFKSRVRTVRHWRPDGCTSAASNFHIRLSASKPRGMNIQMEILQHAISISAMRESGPWEADVRTVEVKSAISILVARRSEPRLTDVWTVIFELRFLPYVWVRPNGKPRRPDVCINLPIFWTWKESEADRSLMDIRTGCWDVQTNASWNRSFSIQWRVRTERYVVRTGWHVVRTDGTVDRWASWRDDTSSGRLIGNQNSSIFSAESSENALTSGILVYSNITRKWFCANTEWGQNTNKLPLWSFWDKNHLTGLEIHSRSKHKNYSPFLSQRDKR
jgi:hypothetical protein